MCVRVFVHVFVRVYVCVWECMFVRVCVYLCLRVCECVCVHIVSTSRTLYHVTYKIYMCDMSYLRDMTDLHSVSFTCTTSLVLSSFCENLHKIIFKLNLHEM